MITIRYTCKGCGLDKQEVQVPARKTADQDVCEWMRDTAFVVADDHRRRKPACPSNHCDLLIPQPPEAEFIGQQIE